MTDQEEFEEWFLGFSDGDFASSKESWMTCAEQKNKVIEQQDKELEALRGFAKDTLKYDSWHRVGKYHRLLDESGNPTKLLTG